MPRGNGMGPKGQGPKTGRGAGFCAGYDVPGYYNAAVPGFGGRFGAGYRHGNGRGFGKRGLGFRQWFRGAIPAEMTAEGEKAFLKNQVEILAHELENANKRLVELDASKES